MWLLIVPNITLKCKNEILDFIKKKIFKVECYLLILF